MILTIAEANGSQRRITQKKVLEEIWSQEGTGRNQSHEQIE